MQAEEENIFLRPKKKRSKLRKAIRIFLASLGIFLFLMTTAVFVIVYFFEDEIKKYAVEQINQEINTKIEVKDIKLSLFKKFPHASLEFMDVKCVEATESKKKDYLLEAKSVFLQFSIFDIFRGKYTFKKLSVENGKLNLKIFENGMANFDILKKDPKPVPGRKKEMSFRFNEFILKNIHFSYIDQKAIQEYRAQINYLSCAGSFTDKKYTLKGNASIFTEVISIGQQDYMTNKKISLKTSVDINTETNICKINSGLLTVENMRLQLDGMFKFDSTVYTDIHFKGDNLNVQSFLSLLPSSYKTFEKKYKSKGDFYLEGSVKGNIGEGYNPHIAAKFGVEKGEVKFTENGLKMRDLFFKGSFDTGPHGEPSGAYIHIEKFSARLENSSVAGNFYIKNLDRPHLKFSLDADADLAEIFTFFPVEKIQSASGRVKAHLSYEGALEGNEFGIDDYKKSVTNGNVSLTGVSIKIKDQPLDFSNLNGQVTFQNTSGSIPQLSGKIIHTDFSLHGTVENLLEFIYLHKYPLVIRADIECNKIVLEDFMVKGEKKTNNKQELSLLIPKDIDIHLEGKVGELSFKKFFAKNIKGSVVIKNQSLWANDLQFEACGGTAHITGKVNTEDPDNITTEAFGSFSNIIINNLFYQFENFSQTTIEDKHIKGRVKADITYKANFDKKLAMKLNTLYVYSPLVIENGELINFKPLESLAKFIKLEELRHIRFSTLTNTIEIKDESVIIPKMTILSSALNIEIGGVHYFDNRIEYYFNVFLKDLLAAKMKNKKNGDDFGEFIEEEGGARIYLKMTGTVDDPKISIDKKGVKEKIKDDMKKENQNMKQIFYEEFGMFKNDSTIKKDNLTPPKKDKKNKVKDSEEFEFE